MISGHASEQIWIETLMYHGLVLVHLIILVHRLIMVLVHFLNQLWKIWILNKVQLNYRKLSWIPPHGFLSKLPRIISVSRKSKIRFSAFKKACEFVNSVVAEGYWKGYISMHSYAQKIISSYAVSLEEFPHDPFSIDEMNASGKARSWYFSRQPEIRTHYRVEIFDLLKAISEAMTAVHGVTYTYGQSREILYPSSGTSKDWVLDDFQVPLRKVFKKYFLSSASLIISSQLLALNKMGTFLNHSKLDMGITRHWWIWLYFTSRTNCSNISRSHGWTWSSRQIYRRRIIR